MTKQAMLDGIDAELRRRQRREIDALYLKNLRVRRVGGDPAGIIQKTVALARHWDALRGEG